MRIFKISTTAYEEEDFYLMTTLSEEQIKNAIKQIVMRERDGEEEYDNEMLLDAIKKKYPRSQADIINSFQNIII